MADTLISVEHVSKKFCRDLQRSLRYGVRDMVSAVLGRGPGRLDCADLRKDEFWAVRDLSFDLKRGECLGLIGRNGAGKSSLLKMLNGLIKPDAGRIRMWGRIGALIELGTGFNPILSGRENIYINGSILGFSKREMNRKYDAIVEFSEIGDFIDMPVKNYSSGMKVRLGFAVAAQMEPDILLIDEVLAVGDTGFKIKCYNEINRIMERAAIVFVSHSMPQIGRVCTRGMLMRDGAVAVASDNIAEVISAYHGLFGEQRRIRHGSGEVTLAGIRVGSRHALAQALDPRPFEEQSHGIVDLVSGEPVCIRMQLKAAPEITEFKVKFTVTDMEQKIIALVLPTQPVYRNRGRMIELVLDVRNLVLNTGVYALNLVVLRPGATDFGDVLLGYRNVVQLRTTYPVYVGTAPVIFHAAPMDTQSG